MTEQEWDELESSEYSERKGWVLKKMSDTVETGIDKLAAALAVAQGKFEGAKKDAANPFHKSKYADLASVWDAVRLPLAENGLSVVQLIADAPAGHIRLVTIILHSSGQKIESAFNMPVKDAGNPQAVGSALTYARRYALMAALGVAPEDDDGNAATTKTTAKKSDSESDTIALTGAVKKKADDYMSKFESSGSAEEKKKVYLSLKEDASVWDAYKFPVLNQMAAKIKESKNG